MIASFLLVHNLDVSKKLNELLKAMVYLDLLEQNEPNLKYFKGESRRVMGTAKQLVKVIDMLRLEGGYEELAIVNIHALK